MVSKHNLQFKKRSEQFTLHFANWEPWRKLTDIKFFVKRKKTLSESHKNYKVIGFHHGQRGSKKIEILWTWQQLQVPAVIACRCMAAVTGPVKIVHVRK